MDEKKTELKREDVEKISCAIDRARRMGVDVEDSNNVILFLENEIEMYRQANLMMKAFIDGKKINDDYDNQTLPGDECRFELIDPVGNLLKALSENGYNNISINAYKTESEV